MTGVAGHVFAIHGSLKDVVYDAVVIPTDTDFTVEPHWHAIDGVQPSAKPEQWTQRAFARAGTSTAWYLDVTENNYVLDAATLAERVDRLLHEIVGTLADARPRRDRAKHLIAMPLLASGRGGQAAGQAVRTLLAQLEESVKILEVDVAICVLKRNRFEAVQHERRLRRRKSPGPYDENARELAAHARKGALALMLGAGVSMAAGLPSWATLIEKVAARVPKKKRRLVSGKSFTDLPMLDQAELLDELLGKRFTDAVVEATVSMKGHTGPSLAHFLLAGLRCPQVATTNYDLLYETALESQGEPRPAAVPRQVPAPGAPWILKLHGDIEDKKRIVLSRRSFIGYDAQQGPAGALFQSMLMTQHVLFVGLSFTDDNLLRLTHEVADYLYPKGGPNQERKIGSVITLGHNESREALWKRHLEWQGVEDPRKKPEGDGLVWRARELEILVDAIAVWGTPDEGVFSDPLLGDLLTQDEQSAAQNLQAWKAFDANRATQP